MSESMPVSVPNEEPSSGWAARLSNWTGGPAAWVVAFLLLGLMGGLLGFVHAGRLAEVAAPAVAESVGAAVPAAPPSRASAPTPQLLERSASAAPAWPLWEYQLDDPLPAREPPLTPVDWKLLGATLSNGRWEMVVLRQGKTQPEYFKVGDKLPGGLRVREITQENVTLVAGRREIVLAYIGSR